ncbi:TIGR00730 family Rossman fold protein [Bacteroidota bacterium]
MNICIFGASSKQISHIYFRVAEDLGELIGKGGHVLVHGGGMEGLMGKVAEHVQQHSGKVIGIIPEKLNRSGVVREQDNETIVTKTMAERKEKMFDLADAFIALPGGFGTLEELLEIMTLNQLGYTEKPVIILNTNNYYDSLLEQFKKLFEENFAASHYTSLYRVAETANEAMDYLCS